MNNVKTLFFVSLFIMKTAFCSQATSELAQPLIENNNKSCFSRLRKKIVSNPSKCLIWTTVIALLTAGATTMGIVIKNSSCTTDNFVLKPGECSWLNFNTCNCGYSGMAYITPPINETITPQEIYAMVGPTSGPRCYDMCLSKLDPRACGKLMTKQDLQKQLSNIARC